MTEKIAIRNACGFPTDLRLLSEYGKSLSAFYGQVLTFVYCRGRVRNPVTLWIKVSDLGAHMPQDIIFDAHGALAWCRDWDGLESWW